MSLSKQAIATFLIVCTFLIIAPQVYFQGSLGDLLAVWLAASSYQDGLAHIVYPNPDHLFTVTAPAEWVQAAQDLGYEGPIYPYVYPPLVAAGIAPLTEAIDYSSFVLGAGIANAALLAGMVLLAASISTPRPQYPVFVVVSLGLLSLSKIGLLAMHENQPQILVAFLLVLVIERSQAGRLGQAGIALALAAAIKAFPAIFIIVFIVRGQWRAVLAFAIGGAALGTASVFLAGWPLHAAFLDQLSAINNSVIVGIYSYNINSAIAVFGWSETLTIVEGTYAGIPNPEPPKWQVLARPAAWSFLGTVANVTVVSGLALVMRFQPRAAVPAWALLIAASALLMPLAWPYYYIPSLVFMPILLVALGPFVGGTIIAGTLLATTIILPEKVAEILNIPHLGLFPGLVGILVLILGYALAVARLGRHPS